MATISYSREGNVGVIEMNGPPANSYGISFMRELDAAIDAAEGDEACRVVVLRSAVLLLRWCRYQAVPRQHASSEHRDDHRRARDARSAGRQPEDLHRRDQRPCAGWWPGDRVGRSVYDGANAALAAGLAVERRNIATLFHSDDAKEGFSAFAERRKPNFSGR